MCGIAGILNLKKQPVQEKMLTGMTKCLAHRGPDSDGFFIDNEIALGHRRLSIIDLSPLGNQPFTDNSGRYVMIFNGEMYNFQEVKREITDYEFKSSSDTEVLIAAFAKWGPLCINRFKGMFAFAIWDKQEKELTVMRDRMGVKPLYYFASEDHFLFASETRSILSTGLVKRKINRKGLLEFLSYQSIGFPLTAIENVYQLEAGSYLRIKNGNVEINSYWKVTDQHVDFDFADEKAVQVHIRELLADAVSRRLVSDVPVGAFLSGGIDSSVVVGLMSQASSARVNSFNIAFEEKEYDESSYAEIIAKKFNTNHTRINLKPSVFLEELENGLNAMDTPSGDGINSYVVSKAIREAGITVALSGIGGDELFAGYPFFLKFLQLKNKAAWWRGTGMLRKLISLSLTGRSSSRKHRFQQILTAPSPDIEHLYPVFREILSPQLIKKLTHLHPEEAFETELSKLLNERKESISGFPLLSQVSVAEYLGYTQHTLLKDTDQMSMAVSLEVREPFFDHELVAFVLSIPDDVKYPGFPKRLLVEAVDGLLPDEIVHRQKRGFLFPWNIWMKNELKSFCEQKLTNLARRNFINGKELIQYWKRFLNDDPVVRWAELWLFVVLEYWMEKNQMEE
jgi:asparagine synthase (glutamine-hydrolysing)